jgi:DNA-binding transcriptional LysR family regulator
MQFLAPVMHCVHGPSAYCTLRVMELRELEAFLAVARELHFARAAESLIITQPALSRRIQSLERELSAQLFLRDRRTVQLTSAGQVLVGPATEAVEAVRRAGAAVRAAAAGRTGQVRVAYAGTSSQTMMAELARVAGRDFPEINVELLSSNFALPALDKVVRGDVDLAFGRWSDVPSGITTRIVAVESLVIALPADHPLANQRRVRMASLRDERWITLPSNLGSVLITRLRRISASAGFVPNVVQEAPDTWTVIALVEAGIGCSLTLSSVADNVRRAGVRFVELEDQGEPVEVRMAWREDALNAALRPLLKLARELFPSPARPAQPQVAPVAATPSTHQNSRS